MRIRDKRPPFCGTGAAVYPAAGRIAPEKSGGPGPVPEGKNSENGQVKVS